MGGEEEHARDSCENCSGENVMQKKDAKIFFKFNMQTETPGEQRARKDTERARRARSVVIVEFSRQNRIFLLIKQMQSVRHNK